MKLLSESNPINPYAAPVTESAVASRDKILTQIFQAVPELRYRGETRRADLRDAIIGTGMRTDLISKRPLVSMVVVAAGIVLISINSSNPSLIVNVALMVAVIFTVGQMLAIRRVTAAAASFLGMTEGRFGPEGMVIQKPTQTLYYPLSSIVAVASNRRRAVFVFDQALSHFETVRFSDFDQPLLAEATVKELKKHLPPAPPVLLDERRQSQPMSMNFFSPADNASFFDGPIHAADLRGTSFEVKFRQAMRQIWVRLVVYFAAVGAFILVLFGVDFPLVIYAAVGVGFFAIFFYRMRVITKKMIDGNDLLWYSRGWIEPKRFVHVSSIGQSSSSWSTFDQPEANDHSVVFRYLAAPMWMVVSRNQFSTDEAWREAKQQMLAHWEASKRL